MEFLRLQIKGNNKAPPYSVSPTSPQIAHLALPESSGFHMALRMNKTQFGSFLLISHPSISFYHFTTQILDEKLRLESFSNFSMVILLEGVVNLNYQSMGFYFYFCFLFFFFHNTTLSEDKGSNS